MTTTLLLDADIIAFKIASTSQQPNPFAPEEPPVVDEWDDVVPRIHYAVDGLQATLDTDKVIVCLSCPTYENWRLKVYPGYKFKRDYSNRPVHRAAVKDYMEANWPSYRRPTLEADDIMGILSTHDAIVQGKKVIVSEDKDMQTIPGWLFNPAKDAFPRLITPAQADRWHLWQTILGDTVDCYPGCLGAGPDRAKPVLDENLLWSSHQHTLKSGPRKGQEETRWTAEATPASKPWDRVVALFERHGFTEADALVQARVARICRATDYDFAKKEVRLWTPPT
jgi:hypothetical protein